MSNSKSDKKFVSIVIASCAAVILLFSFIWSKQFFFNLGNPVFAIGYGILIGAFVAEAIGAFRYADEPNKEWKRVVIVILTAAICIWAGGWAAGYNEKKAVLDDSDKAKQTWHPKVSERNIGYCGELLSHDYGVNSVHYITDSEASEFIKLLDSTGTKIIW